MRLPLLIPALTLIALALAGASTPAAVSAGGHLEQEAREIAKLLRCPICQNLSVADSPSPLAQQMREIIRDQLAAGQPREAILAYFVERYGEEVLLDPPKQGFSGLLWWATLGMVVGGAALVTLLLRQWLRQRSVAAPPVFALPEAELRAYEALVEQAVGDAQGGAVTGRGRAEQAPPPEASQAAAVRAEGRQGW